MKKLFTLFPGWLLTALPMLVLSQGIEITTGGSIACTGTSTIEIYNGNFINNGTYTKGSESFTMSGSATVRSISGTSLSDFYNLSITNTAGVSIAYNSKVTVSNTLTVDGTSRLTLKSTLDGTASLIENTSPVTATVERYLADYVVVPDFMFHLLSSPVVAQPIRSEFVSVDPDQTTINTSYTDFYSFDETQNMWINTRGAGNQWNANFEDNFLVGKGYLIAYPDIETKEFTGTLNTYASPLNLTCTNTPGKGNGWNLLGNPFPSAIDWDLVSKGDGMDAALYYYDNAEQKYRYYLKYSGDIESYALGSGQQYIPAMQGFMVHASTIGVKTVSIDNGDRTHEGQSVYYKSTQTAPGSLSLTATGNGYEDEAFIHFTEGATSAFDGRYDAYKLKSYSAAVPMIYTVGPDGSELAINGLSATLENTSIPVNFESGTGGTFSITANLDLVNNDKVYLEDTKLDKIQDLKTNSVYDFSFAAGDDANRFLLHFGPLAIEENPAAGRPEIYASGRSVYVSTVLSSTADVFIRNLTGQIVNQSKAAGRSLTVVDVSGLADGIYIVSVVNSNSTYSSKVMLK